MAPRVARVFNPCWRFGARREGRFHVPQCRPPRYECGMSTVLRAAFQATLVISLCWFATGCAALNLQKPTAAVTQMSVGEVNPSGFTLDFGVDLKNPNSFAMPLGAADYDLGIGGSSLLKGQATPSGSIPAHGSPPLTGPRPRSLRPPPRPRPAG